MTSLKKKLISLVPYKFRQRAVDLKNSVWGGYKQTYYSHCGEDIVIDSYFRTKKNGFYVDIGAHHPKRYSNTALLYERGWSGINVDPDSYLLELFKKNRAGDINVNCGVGAENKTLTLHKFSDPAVNTFSDSNAERLKGKKWLRHVGDVSVPVVPLKELLSEYLPEGQKIDFLNIDVEDLDLEVLQSNDWQLYKPTVIAVEDRLFNLSKSSDSEIYNFVIQQGYYFMGYVGLTLLFVDKDYQKPAV